MTGRQEQVRRRVWRGQLAVFAVTLAVLTGVIWELADGGGSRVRITIPEGFTRFEIAKRLEAAEICSGSEFLAAVKDPSTLERLHLPAESAHGSAEGYLFPDTYDFDKNSRPEDVLERMVENFRRRTDALFEGAELGNAEATDPQRPAQQLVWTAHQALIMASIVETEAARASERSVIAGVFYNRLLFPEFRPKRLQADPTVRYGCQEDPQVSEACRQYAGSITKAMLRDENNPYNTYRHEGLPPGPIANPGLAAIRAALDPQHHAFLYFVAKGAGKHTFSRTLEEHNAAVARYRR